MGCSQRNFFKIDDEGGKMSHLLFKAKLFMKSVKDFWSFTGCEVNLVAKEKLVKLFVFEV